MFDSGATDSFVTPEIASKFIGTFILKKVNVSIRTLGNQVLKAENLVLDVPIEILQNIFLANLLIIPLESYDIILGMDWLSRYKANLDCGRGKISFEGRDQPRLAYQGINPSLVVSFVSALRIEKELEDGEAYLVTVTVLENDQEDELEIEDIPIVNEYEDVFKPLEGLPPSRSNPFTINIEPGAVPITNQYRRFVGKKIHTT